MKSKTIPVVLLLAAMLAMVVASQWNNISGGVANAFRMKTVTLVTTPEKRNVFAPNSEVMKRLKVLEFDVKVEYRSAHELHEHAVTGKDASWFMTRMDAQAYPGDPIDTEAICHSPVVMLMSEDIYQALRKSGYVVEGDNRAWFSNGPKFLELAARGRPWSDVGIINGYGLIKVEAGDPHQSSAAEAARLWEVEMLNGGKPITQENERTIVERLTPLYKGGKRLGSSLELFKLFRRKRAEHPIIMVDEHLVLEQDAIQKLPADIRIVYSNPTRLSDHVAVAYTNLGRDFLEAMMDPEIQKLLWKNHGYRQHVGNLDLNNERVKRLRIAGTITSALKDPDPATFEKFIDDVVARE